MAGASGKGKEGSDFGELSDYLYMAAAIVIILFMLWFAFRQQLTWLLFHARDFALLVIGAVSDGAASMRRDLHIVAAHVDPKKIEYEQFKNIAQATGMYARWLWVPLAILFAAANLFMGNPVTRLKRVFTPESLAKDQMKVWPEITPVVGLNLSQGDITAGPWRVTETEREFANKRGILDENGDVDRQKARAAFASQLGAPWRGPQALRPHIKAIYAVLAMTIDGRGDDGLKYIRQMAAQHGDGPEGSYRKIDFSWADNEIKKTEKNELIKKINALHAYETGVMATMLQASRLTGVLASSLFIWLRPVDRTMFFVLNSAGRYGFFAECSGAMCHWLHEKTTGERSVMPMVDKAIDGLEEALLDFVDEDPFADALK